MTGTLQAVYDVADQGWWGLTDDQRDQIRAWATEHGIDVDVTYRMEIHVIDMPLARVFQHDLTEDGQRHCPIDHDHMQMDKERQCDVARREPYDVPISSMPPVQPAGAGRAE